MNLDDTITHIQNHKQEKLLKLVSFSFKILYELEEYYFYDYKYAAESGYIASCHINYLHFRIIQEAIEIKRGKEDQLLNNPLKPRSTELLHSNQNPLRAPIF